MYDDDVHVTRETTTVQEGGGVGSGLHSFICLNSVQSKIRVGWEKKWRMLGIFRK